MQSLVSSFTKKYTLWQNVLSTNATSWKKAGLIIDETLLQTARDWLHNHVYYFVQRVKADFKALNQTKYRHPRAQQVSTIY